MPTASKEYLAMVWSAGHKVEAHVYVQLCHGDVESTFCNSLAYVDDEVYDVEKLGEQLQLLLIDDACKQWAMQEKSNE